ncbi:rab proteins geranylgeranyltransferase component A 2 [Ciona intestinalis]
MNEALPDEFDVIIIGTGLPASVVSGALSRINKKVLHLDRNDYYGGSWSSFNIKSVETFLQNPYDSADDEHTSNIEVSENEEFVPILQNKNFITKAECSCHLKHSEKTEEPAQLTSPSADTCQSDEVEQSCHSKPESLKSGEIPITEGVQRTEESTKVEDCNDPATQGDGDSVEKEKELGTQELYKAKTEEKVDVPEVVKPRFPHSEDFYKQWRHYNLDLSPKVMFSRGLLVELLIQSNVSRYLEFRNVTRTLTFLDGSKELQRVPCSRADVFSSKFVSVVEKRILMRLFTLCANYKDHEQEYQDFKEKTFLEFLASRRLSLKAQHFVLHSIAMVSETASTLDGLAATHKFLHSLGRYGNSAFLWPSYGVGEIPQAFCRFSAVFGGTFCLRRYAVGFITDKTTGRCTGIVDNTGQKIRCETLILDDLNLPHGANTTSTSSVDRAIYVIDSTVSKSDTEQVSLVTIPPRCDNPAVRLIEAGPLCCVCPKNNYIVHGAMERTDDVTDSPKKRFQPMEEMVFSGTANDETNIEPEVGAGDNQSRKPVVLWSCHFTMTDTNTDNSTLPPNVITLHGPRMDLGFDRAMKEAREVFLRICPDEDFLPRAPDPEEIVFDDEGYNTENNGTIPATPEDGGGDYVEEEEEELDEPAAESHEMAQNAHDVQDALPAQEEDGAGHNPQQSNGNET